MEPDKIYNDIRSLSPAARRQVADFVSFLKARSKKSRKAAKRIDLIEDPFVGIWADRKDMNDSCEWVRKIRNAEWGGSD